MQQANINKTQQNQPHSRKVYALRLGLDLERPSKVTQVQARIRQSNRMTAKQSIVARAREISRTVVNFRLFQRVQASGFTEFTAQGCREHRLNRAQGFGPGRKARRITGHGGLRGFHFACQGAQGKCQAMQQLADVVSQTAVACRVRASSAVLISIRS